MRISAGIIPRKMSFDVVFNYILKRTGAGVGAGLEGFRALLARLGNPQNQYKIVHIAGTNGKGSVSTLMAGTLTAAGHKTGLLCRLIWFCLWSVFK